METPEPRTGVEKDGREYLLYDVGDWCLYAAQVQAGSPRWELLLLPAGYAQKFNRICAGTRQEIRVQMDTALTVLVHITTQGLKIPPSDDAFKLAEGMIEGK